MKSQIIDMTREYLKFIPIGIIIVSIVGGIIYWLGSQTPHEPTNHPLNKIFEME